ncbi:helix-turn-helix transcriptional regulator [Nguyenibacter vanlangensis]|uniref:helix-turn-helix transcriptional regulator n=1 Tax=Nguyenibacter vanlangensis TaxID=1216886 RepID=UPI0038CFFB20
MRITTTLDPIVLTERQAAARLGLSADYLYRLRVDGPRRRSSAEQPLPPGPTYLRIGRRIVYRPADLDAWLAALADGSVYARQSRGRGRPRKSEFAARQQQAEG